MRPFVEQDLLEEPVAQDALSKAGVNRDAPVKVVGAEYLGNTPAHAPATRSVGMRRIAGVHVDLLSARKQHGGQAAESLRVYVHFGPRGVLAAEFGVDLELDATAVHAGFEQVGVDGRSNPGRDSPRASDRRGRCR